MPSPAELRKLADQADREAEDLERNAAARARILRGQAAELRRLAAAGDEGLRAIYPDSTVGISPMEAQSNPLASAGAKKAWAKIKDALPFQVALYRRGLSLPEWARAQRKPSLSVHTAKSWLKRKGRGGNRIPREWAERIAREFGEVDAQGNLVSSEVPAVDASWPCGIRPSGAS